MRSNKARRHCCKAASEAVARTRAQFVFVDAPAYLTQDEAHHPLQQ